MSIADFNSTFNPIASPSIRDNPFNNSPESVENEDVAPTAAASISILQFLQLKAEFLAASALTQYEYVDVTFPSGANTDFDIRHSLTVTDPESVDYQLVRSDRACRVYNDQSGTRRSWGANFIILRCDTASAVCRILLMVRRLPSSES